MIDDKSLLMLPYIDSGGGGCCCFFFHLCFRIETFCSCRDMQRVLKYLCCDAIEWARKAFCNTCDAMRCIGILIRLRILTDN